MNRGLAASLAPLSRILAAVDPQEVEAFEKQILAARRVFVTGLGRTGLVGRGFAMRLMPLGRRVYHVGDVITPAIRRGDLLVICSRTGRSPVLLYYIDIARRADARVAVLTGVRTSPVARRADVILYMPTERRLAPPPKKSRRNGAPPSLPLGSLFEQALLLVLDHVVVLLMATLGLTSDDLRRIHTTFE